MGAADQRDPTPEPHDQPGGTVQRAGAGGLESGGGRRGGEEGDVYMELLLWWITCDVVYMEGFKKSNIYIVYEVKMINDNI